MIKGLYQILVLVSGLSDPLLDFADRLSKESPAEQDNVARILQSLDKDEKKFLDEDNPSEEAMCGAF